MFGKEFLCYSASASGADPTKKEEKKEPLQPPASQQKNSGLSIWGSGDRNQHPSSSTSSASPPPTFLDGGISVGLFGTPIVRVGVDVHHDNDSSAATDSSTDKPTDQIE